MVCGVWFTTLHHFWIKVCCNYIIVWSFYPFKKFHGPAFNKPCATTSVRELSVSGFLKVASSGLERYQNHPNPPQIADKDCYGGSWSHQAWSKPTVYILYKSTLCSTWKCHFFSASNTLRVALSTGRAVRPAAARPWSLLWGPLSCSDHLPGRQKNQPWRQPVVSPTFNIQLISTREDITLFSCYVYTFKYTHKYTYEYTYK